VDNVAYLSSDIEMMTLTYNLNEYQPFTLCEYMTASNSNQNDCPGDGTYGFTVNYQLPSAGDERSSWLASGWNGQGTFKVYAEMDESMMIGMCTFYMKTYVTPDANRGVFQTPSAAAAIGITLGATAAFVLFCVYWRCCRCSGDSCGGGGGGSGNSVVSGGGSRFGRGSRAGSFDKDEIFSQLTKDDVTTLFKRLDEETRSQNSVSPSLLAAAKQQQQQQRGGGGGSSYVAAAASVDERPLSPMTAASAQKQSQERPISPDATTIPKGGDDGTGTAATETGGGSQGGDSGNGSNKVAAKVVAKTRAVVALFNRHSKKKRSKPSDMAL